MGVSPGELISIDVSLPQGASTPHSVSFLMVAQPDHSHHQGTIVRRKLNKIQVVDQSSVAWVAEQPQVEIPGFLGIGGGDKSASLPNFGTWDVKSMDLNQQRTSPAGAGTHKLQMYSRLSSSPPHNLVSDSKQLDDTNAYTGSGGDEGYYGPDVFRGQWLHC